MFNETFWVGIATALFLAAVYRPLSRVLLQTLDQRAKQIENELNEAMRLREEAQELLVSIQRKQGDAEQEAEEIIAEAKHTAESMTEEARKQLEAALNKRIEIAMNKIAQAEATALRDVQENIADIAVNAARALIKDHITKSHADRLIQNGITDIGKKLH